MPAIRYSLSLGDLVSDDLRGAIRRRMREIGGIGLLAVAGIAALALATWSVQDPSFSHATNAPARNALGIIGAASADLMMQILGIATVALLLPVASWGWRLLTHRVLERQRLRLIFWVAGTIAAAGFASCLAPSKSWPLPTGLGGVVGDSLLHVPAWVFGPLSGAPRFVIAIMLGVAAVIMLALAAGFGLRRDADEEAEEKPKRKVAKAKAEEVDEEEEEDEREKRSFVSLGWLYHFLYSVKARLLLLPAMLLAWLPWRRRPRVVPLRQDPAAVTMIEPHDEAYSNPADDLDDEAEVDEEDAEEEVEVAPRKRIKQGTAPVKRRKGGYELPSLALLAAPRAIDRQTLSDDAIQENAKALESVLSDFGVRGEIINAHPGPVVTLYELEPAPGIKSSRVIGLSDDIARSMSKVSARVAVVQGRNAIGIELPNPKREKVLLREMPASARSRNRG